MIMKDVQVENLGAVVISPRVIETIVSITTSNIDGLYSLRNKSFSDFLGKNSEGRGVYISQDEDGLVDVDVYVFLSFGVNVPSVAMNIQKEIKEAVFNMTGIEINDVNVHVSGIVPAKTPKPKHTDLFDGGDFLDAE
ncbi:hypothetical protein BG262_04240 [Floricoccus penangensis]|uniref:Alkaline-shock protein n=1 Tax=Floricoccus penangensis TaxID=1859475 RepID=A0A9Q5NZV6_9LACT|nr:hypothetical protein BG262_04240 [Floricoccus penangensis]